MHPEPEPEPESSPSQHGCAGFRNLSRRQALTVGSLGALGMSMGDLFRLQGADKQALSIAGGDRKGPKAQSGKAILFDVKSGKRLAAIGDEIDVVLAAD